MGTCCDSTLQLISRLQTRGSSLYSVCQVNEENTRVALPTLQESGWIPTTSAQVLSKWTALDLGGHERLNGLSRLGQAHTTISGPTVHFKLLLLNPHPAPAVQAQHAAGLAASMPQGQRHARNLGPCCTMRPGLEALLSFDSAPSRLAEKS